VALLPSSCSDSRENKLQHVLFSQEKYQNLKHTLYGDFP